MLLSGVIVYIVMVVFLLCAVTTAVTTSITPVAWKGKAILRKAKQKGGRAARQRARMGQIKDHGSKFGRKQEEAIAALLTQRNVEEAARSIGVAPNTLLDRKSTR